ncbi:MAG: dUTP diphosphatase [Erysipelotrichales bacterium]
MKYDLSILSKPQADLDKTILDNHNIIDVSTTTNKRILAFLVELGELANETRCFKYWSLKEASANDIVLEEYVDGIHFLTSLTNQLDMKPTFEIETTKRDLSELFIEIFSFANKLKNEFNKENLEEIYKVYLNLGFNLGFDNDSIVDAYFKKNEINFKRQEDGY